MAWTNILDAPGIVVGSTLVVAYYEAGSRVWSTITDPISVVDGKFVLPATHMQWDTVALQIYPFPPEWDSLLPVAARLTGYLSGTGQLEVYGYGPFFCGLTPDTSNSGMTEPGEFSASNIFADDPFIHTCGVGVGYPAKSLTGWMRLEVDIAPPAPSRFWTRLRGCREDV